MDLALVSIKSFIRNKYDVKKNRLKISVLMVKRYATVNNVKYRIIKTKIWFFSLSPIRSRRINVAITIRFCIKIKPSAWPNA